MNTYILGHASTMTERWRRDERTPVRASEHTHFPHAILEVKLQGDVENPPRWVKDMISSGMVTEVRLSFKFERVYVCICSCLNSCMQACMRVLYVCMYVFVRSSTQVCLYACLCAVVFVCNYVCMYA